MDNIVEISDSSDGEIVETTKDEVKNATQSSLLGLDRAAMERERLARRKRMPSESEREAGNTPKRINVGSSRPTIATLSSIKAAEENPKPSARLNERFWDGVVLKIAVQGYPREDDITIEELWDAEHIEHAVLSSFCTHYPWVLSKLCKGIRKDLTFITVDDAMNDKDVMNHAGKHLKSVNQVRPYLGGNVRTMHSKLQLLFYKDRLRLCIPSANLTDYDWGEAGGVLENIVFIQDYPRSTENNSAKFCYASDSDRWDSEDDFEGQYQQVKQPFLRSLIMFLEAQEVDYNLVAELIEEVDWSKAENLRFVHTIGGTLPLDKEALRTRDKARSHWASDDSHRSLNRVNDSVNVAWNTGFLGLSEAVSSLKPGLTTMSSMKYITSSVGNLTELYCYTIYLAAHGFNLSYTWKYFPGSGRRAIKLNSTESETLNGLEIFFPAREDVAASKGGVDAAGTIFLLDRFWGSHDFPQRLFRPLRSKRQGCLSHSKMFWTDHFVYAGSHNFSPSAWGKLNKNGTFSCANWECGVLIPTDSGVHTCTPVDLEIKDQLRHPFMQSN
ncbi:hypothetical protein CANCADRAFT_1990 [Tortispora caseinolytica NRRL Y-17796]|uniref:PLD phosphodiesterase domain-containing protein n=1 Tax=Tortispora caseinolytica NRRL Y-17796 TaxID=767744 RepID=A0A1E4TEU8_9ASCO|nr:hypothetical protein CANCADRAFT_1990 [Tortispora caseinolytica NRRL Y-17796]